MQKVAITGATGFIGRHLTTYLAGRDVSVRAIVRPASMRPVPAGATLVRAPLQAAPLAEAFAGVDVVVHLAAVVSTVREREYTDINVEGTRAVADAARAAGARLVHVSSLAAAGPAPSSAPRCEEDAPRPLTAYGRSKLESEQVVRSTAGLRWTILRPGVVYGPGDRAMLPLFRLARRSILPLVGCCDAAYTFIYVNDAVRTIEAALKNTAEGETVFVGHSRPVVARELLDLVQSVLGRRATFVRIPDGVAYLAALAGEVAGRAIGAPLPLNRSRLAELSAAGFVCAVDRMRDRLGIVAEVGLREGLSETVAWYRREGWI